MSARVVPAGPNKSDLLTIPTECRLDILRCLLLTSRSRHTKWKLEDVSTEELSQRCSQMSAIRSEARVPIFHTLHCHYALFDSMNCNEITYHISPAVLRVCRQLRDEGTRILYRENAWCALRWDGIGHFGYQPNFDVLADLGIGNKWVMDAEQFAELQRAPKSREQSLMSSLKVTLTPAVDQSEQVRLLPITELETVVRALYLAFIAPGSRVMDRSSTMVNVQGNGSFEVNDETTSILHRIVPSLASFLEDILIGPQSLLLPDHIREALLPSPLQQIKHMCDTPYFQRISLHIEGVTREVAAVETAMKGPTLPQTIASTLLPLLEQIIDIDKACVMVEVPSVASPQLKKRLDRLMAVASWHLIHLDIPADCKALLKHQFLYANLLESCSSPVAQREVWSTQVKQQAFAIGYKLGCEGALAIKPIKEEQRLKVSILD